LSLSALSVEGTITTRVSFWSSFVVIKATFCADVQRYRSSQL
jgi:hypothetical protein